MASGIDDEVTLRANREGFLKFQLRPRRLVDVSKVDMSVDILGARYADADRDRAGRRPEVASTPRARSPRRAARRPATTCMILSTGHHQSASRRSPRRAARRSGTSSTPPTSGTWRRAFVTRAEKAGCPVVAVTVDRSGGRNQETLFRLHAHRHPQLRRLPRPLEPAGEPEAPLDVRGRRRLRPDEHPVVEHDLGLPQAPARHDEDEDRAQGHPRARGRDARGRARHGRRSSSPTTARAARTAAARPSTRCRRSSRRSAAACRCWSTAASAAAPTSCKALAHGRDSACASAGPTSGDSARSASRASSACSSCCASSCTRSCSRSARRR